MDLHLAESLRDREQLGCLKACRNCLTKIYVATHDNTVNRRADRGAVQIYRSLIEQGLFYGHCCDRILKLSLCELEVSLGAECHGIVDRLLCLFRPEQRSSR